MSRSLHFLCILFVILVFADHAFAFGAGAVPKASEFKEFVWRHGDIAEVLRYLPVSFITQEQFTPLQRRQIYFGNWLRDFSQVIDTTCLENVPEAILRAIVSVMGVLEFGFATDEFDVTRARLGCYSHVEHIDNPRGYPDDAKRIDKRLRGPVDPKELEFDPKTGMKNYIANSGQGWDTSADYIRRQLRKCVDKGRKGRPADAQQSDSAAQKEAFIHLGAALHTLEDFAAHSNYVELCLIEMGEKDVFPLVGDGCRVKLPSRFRTRRSVPPLVTGTFGMLDIFHSLLGEADDAAVLQSRGSLGNVEKSLEYGGMAFDQLFDAIMIAISKVQQFSSGNDDLVEQMELVNQFYHEAQDDHLSDGGKSIASIATTASQGGEDSLLWQALEPAFYVHDRIKKWLTEGADTGGEPLSDQQDSQLSEYSDQMLFQFLGMIIESSVKELRNALKAAKARVDQEAQQSGSGAIYTDGSDASDPSHSDLSKDHFSNVLNQPAGLVATVTTNWVTQQIVRCWDDPSVDFDSTVDEVLSILHHPAFPKRKTKIQGYMFDVVENWWNQTPDQEKTKLRSMLSKESVKTRGHENHELTMKDLKGRTKGFGEFPGSRPSLEKPTPKVSFPLKWAINEASSDIQAAFGLVSKAITQPRAFVADGVYGAAGAVVRVGQMTVNTSIWTVQGLSDLISQWWPFK